MKGSWCRAAPGEGTRRPGGKGFALVRGGAPAALAALLLAHACRGPRTAELARDEGPWELEAADETDPDASADADVEAAIETARAQARSGAIERAIETLDAALLATPDRVELFLARGRLSRSAGFLRAAEGDFEHAVRAAPERAAAWFELGRVRFELGLPVRAVDALEEAERLGRDDFTLHLVHARSLRATGDWRAAAARYEKALERKTQPSIELCVEAASLATCGPDRDSAERARALALLDAALAEHSDHAQAWFVRGLLLEDGADRSAPVAAYLRALEIDPEFLAAWTNLALAALRGDDPATARLAAERALSLEPEPSRRALLRRLAEPREP